jgi:hypothetical protein
MNRRIEFSRTTGCRIREGSVTRRSMGERAFILPIVRKFCTLEFVLLWLFF